MGLDRRQRSIAQLVSRSGCDSSLITDRSPYSPVPNYRGGEGGGGGGDR